MSESPRILYEKRMGFGKTVVEDEPQAVEKWKQEIQKIIDCLVSKNYELMAGILGKDEKKMQSIIEFMETMKMNEEDIKYFAVSLWVGNQSNWRGYLPIIGKIFFGSRQGVSALARDNKGAISCYESSILAKRMADEFDIAGEIVARDKGVWSHKYFKSSTGRVIDNFWGWDRYGYFKDQEDYETNMKADYSHRCFRSNPKNKVS